jgi:hippurate hydrolase
MRAGPPPLEWRQDLRSHSCGHDVHMTVWAGAAKALLARKDQWRGTLMFVAQPDEEGDRGARANAGRRPLQAVPAADYALALHVAPIPYGTFGFRPGPTMAASDTVEITFRGRGGHGAAPQTAIDPIVVAAASSSTCRRSSVARRTLMSLASPRSAPSRAGPSATSSPTM